MKWSRDSILLLYREWINKNQRLPRVREALDDRLPSAHLIKKYFQSVYTKFLKEHFEGYEFTPRKKSKGSKWNKECIIKAYVDWHVYHGRYPSRKDIQKNPLLPAPDTIKLHFGIPTNAFINEYLNHPPPQNRWSKELIISVYDKWIKANLHRPTTNECIENKLPRSSTIERHFHMSINQFLNSYYPNMPKKEPKLVKWSNN